MDGPSHAAGAVAAISGIRGAVSVARRVMEKTPHVMLAGYNARRFAIQQGFAESDLLTPESWRRWKAWRFEQTAPDVAHFEALTPSPSPGASGEALGVRASDSPSPTAWERGPGDEGHDTVGVCALDQAGNLAAACTTSGLAWKAPGRVGDSPIVGSGLYVDNEIGAAVATGNGDEIMKVCLSFQVVGGMERGLSPQEACEEAIRYLLRKRPGRQDRGAACIAVSKDGRHGYAACERRSWRV